MMLDELDKFILTKILDEARKKKYVSTWTLAKKFPWSQEDKGKFVFDSDEKKFYDEKTNLIVARLRKFQERGFVKIEKYEEITKNGKKILKNAYVILGNKVKKNKHRFPDKLSMALSMKGLDGKWTIQEL